jgi:transposase
MSDTDARKLGREAQEVLRFRGVDAVNSNHKPAEIATLLGVGRSTAYGWVRKAARFGRESLRTKPIPGAAPKLDAGQRAQLRAWVLQKPKEHGFERELWTRPMVRELIARKFGVDVSLSTVTNYLRKERMSPQKPRRRAYQADPVAVEEWTETTYPAIARRAEKNGAKVYFEDEAGIRSDYHSGTTWGAVGETPIVETTGSRFSVNMISAVSADGDMRFQLIRGTVNARIFRDYCKRLLKDAGTPVILICDGHPIHKAKIVREWIESTGGRFELQILPAYSPQLNPDEGVWKRVKYDRMGRQFIAGPDDLRSKAMSALRSLQRRVESVRSCFGGKDLEYIRRANATA